MSYSIDSISAILKVDNSVIHQPDALISELCFDSRKVSVPLYSLFFAIKSEKNNGHDFIDSLVKRGVINFIITENINNYLHYTHCNFIQVSNTISALQQIAAFHRSRFSLPVVGITGSNGKTIVKEWISSMLSDDYTIVKSPNSYNSQIGVPFSVWQISEKHNLAVFEAGISKPNEMTALQKIIQPTIGILTNIGPAHSQYFENDEAKLVEKLKLFASAHELIYCQDNPLISEVVNRYEYNHLTKLSWGKNRNAAYVIDAIVKHTHHTSVILNGDHYDIPFIDQASVENALQATVLLLHLGFSPTKINQKMALLTSISMRMEIIEATGKSILINDTYSLDLNSLKIALDFLHSQTQLQKKSLIISDFEQVGKFSKENFLEIDHLLQSHHISKLIAIGENFYANRSCFQIFEQYFFKTTEDFLQNMEQMAFQNEAILIKGARQYKFEQIVSYLQYKTHQTILSVNLSALIHNLNYYRSLLQPSTKMVAMVKALSYGLGDVELINELTYHNIDYLAVAYTDEGVRLRKRNVRSPIIVLGAEAHSFEAMIHYDLEPEVFNFFYLNQLIKILEYHSELLSFNIHIKLDTGMHRLGFDMEDLPQLISLIKSHPQLHIASIFSHLAAAEDPAEDDFTYSQIALFEQMSAQIIHSFNYPILRHILNSAGISRFPQAQMDMVRLGIGLYGFSAVEKDQQQLQHCATLKTIITQIKKIAKGETIGYNRSAKAEKEMKIAIIPIGYADGLPRELSNGKGKVYVNHHYAPFIGKICMDMAMIDVTHIKVNEGDEVIVYGDQNPIRDVAASINRIPYELMTSISKRVQRIYVID